MITTSILWALVLGLFTIPNERNYHAAKAKVITVDRPLRERCYPMAISQIDWAFWFVQYAYLPRVTTTHHIQ